MAILYPSTGPRSNNSIKAEPQVYSLLKSLDDSFTIIHSIAWLMYDREGKERSSIGEIDFIIFHPSYGVIAIEVKGGLVHLDEDGFYYDGNNHSKEKIRIYPIEQLNRGLWKLQNLLLPYLEGLKVSRVFIFPESNLRELPISIKHEESNLVIQKPDIANFEKKLVKIISKQKQSHNVPNYSNSDIKRAINKLLPKCRSLSFLSDQIDYNKKFLKFTQEQFECARTAILKQNFIITGWPGSGKTIILIQLARYFSKNNIKVLFLTHNTLLRKKISDSLRDHRNCSVSTLYSYIGTVPDIKNTQQTARELKKALSNKDKTNYDVVITDESQSFHSSYWEAIYESFREKRIIVSLDDSQKLSFENGCDLNFLESLFEERAYTLSESLRVPKKVCERIKLFELPKHAIINKRELNESSLLEIVTEDIEREIKKVFQQLNQEGVSEREICVLAPFSSGKIPSGIVPQGVEVESIGRFRGLEKPVVIIYGTSPISNRELFCSYSRATTKCISILDYKMVTKGHFEDLSKDLKKHRLEEIEKISNSQKNKTLINDLDLDLEIINKDLLDIYWSKKYNFLFVPPHPINPILSVAFSDYFHKKSKTPICYYFPDSENIFFLSHQDEHNSALKSKISYCEKCKEKSFKNEACISCIKNKERKFNLKNEIKKEIKLILENKNKTPEQKKNLPTTLSIILSIIKSPKLFGIKKIIKLIENRYPDNTSLFLIHYLVAVVVIHRQKNIFSLADIVDYLCCNIDEYLEKNNLLPENLVI